MWLLLLYHIVFPLSISLFILFATTYYVFLCNVSKKTHFRAKNQYLYLFVLLIMTKY